MRVFISYYSLILVRLFNFFISKSQAAFTQSASTRVQADTFTKKSMPTRVNQNFRLPHPECSWSCITTRGFKSSRELYVQIGCSSIAHWKLNHLTFTLNCSHTALWPIWDSDLIVTCMYHPFQNMDLLWNKKAGARFALLWLFTSSFIPLLQTSASKQYKKQKKNPLLPACLVFLNVLPVFSVNAVSCCTQEACKERAFITYTG